MEPRIMRIKRRIYEIIEVSKEGDIPSRIFYIFIMSLIFLSVVAVILETVESLAEYRHIFHIFDVFSVVVFTIEYILRMWTCTLDKRFKRPVAGRLRYAVTFMALVDLFAVLPFYLPMFVTLDLRFIRALRLFRLFRLFKMGRYSKSMKMLATVLKSKREEMFITVFVLSILLVISSSLIYFCEKDVQPQIFSSIPAAMWWGVETLTTVGYGDVCPQTPIGKILSAFIAILGIGVFALPTGIIASGFVEEINKQQKAKKTVCPHCGKEIEG